MLNKITLENFRSFKKKSFKFSEKTQIIGKNGSGKSNLLEAIRYSSIFKSFRVKREKYLINNENEYFNLKSSFENNDGDKKEIFVNFSDKKTVSINKNKVPVSKLIGEIPTVLFWEDDLNILLGSPSYRRKFINSAICQYSKIYLKDLVEYNKVIKQRNRQLFLISVNRLNENLLDIWDEQLVILNRKINQKRVEFFKLLQENYQRIIGLGKSDFRSLKIVPKLTLINQETLSQQRKIDIKYNHTTIGSHHDDLLINFKGKNLANFGSRGQQKTAIIFLKLAEKELLESQIKNKLVILLLDDIFSELDKDNQKLVLDTTKNGQVILSSIEEQEIEGEIIKL